MACPIAINARYLQRRPTGVERYAREISSRLAPPVRAISFGRVWPHSSRLNLGWRGHLWEQVALPMLIRKDEVLWSPANSGPWTISRQAVTLHDASPFDHPEWFHSNFIAWTRLAWQMLIRICAAVITVSEFSARRLKAHFPALKQKLFVIPNGVGQPFRPVPRDKVREIRYKYGISTPYFFFAGTHEPRKNIGRLFEAWVLSSLNGIELVLAGETGSIFHDAGYQKVPLNTRLLGYIPEYDLAGLYSGALAVVIPSLYEGFCLTVLEAMACGAPVITSDTSSLPEVTNGSALIINPLEAASIAQAFIQILDDPGLTNDLRERGYIQAERFNWESSAKKLQAVLHTL